MLRSGAAKDPLYARQQVNAVLLGLGSVDNVRPNAGRRVHIAGGGSGATGPGATTGGAPAVAGEIRAFLRKGQRQGGEFRR